MWWVAWRVAGTPRVAGKRRQGSRGIIIWSHTIAYLRVEHAHHGIRSCDSVQKDTQFINIK